MPGLLTWALVGVLVYTVAAMSLQAFGYVPSYISVSGPLLTVHTKRGRALLDRLAQRERFWRAWGNLGIGIALVVMVLSGVMVVIAVASILAQPESAAIENPQNILVIPGVNDFLPLSAAPEIVFALLVGLVVHEGGHGLLCRVEDIGIESMGVALFAFIPIGAFVEPDEEDQDAADRGAQTRMFAAGITNNFAVTAITLILLLPVVASIAVAAGAPVGDTIPGSGAAAADIERGDVITAINGTSVENASEMEETVATVDSDRLEVERKDNETVVVQRRLLVVGAVGDLVQGINLTETELPEVETVNGTAVSTESQFATAVENRQVAAIETTRGNATLPVGALSTPGSSDSPIVEAGAPADESFIVTAIDGNRVTNTLRLRPILERYEPGETVTVEAYVDGQRQTYDVELGERDDGGAILGIRAQRGYSGLLFDDFGADPYPAQQFLGFLGGGSVNPDLPLPAQGLAWMALLLVLPFMTLFDPSMNYNFAGFTTDVVGFYTTTGPLSFMGGSLFLAANLLFWTWWLNFNLALFNCIPAFPLDGGHIFRTSTESIVSRLPVANGRRLVTAITLSMTLGMGGALALMVFGPALLG